MDNGFEIPFLKKKEICLGVIREWIYKCLTMVVVGDKKRGIQIGLESDKKETTIASFSIYSTILKY